MGISSSKKSSRQRRARIEDNVDVVPAALGPVDGVPVDAVNKFDEQVISTIKKDLTETPELFVLNNMLMSVMFFRNYQKEIEEMARKRYEKDEESIAPDVLLENVNKNVIYRPLHGAKKFTSETLVPKRLYVVSDIVQVVSSLESVPTNTKRAAVTVEASARKGYVKLKEVDASSLPEEGEDIPVAKCETTPSTSRSSTDSDNYGYTTITDIKTPKPIEIIKGLQKQDGKTRIPPSCISYRKIKKLVIDELEEKDIENITEDDLYDMVSYINSKGFMKFFETSVFPNSISNHLGFKESEVKQAKSIPGKIFCGQYEGDRHTPCEVIPALTADWPHKQTLQFILKAQRPPEARKRYIFPTQRMINEIQSLNCVLVPKGYVKKKGEHTDSDLEWELQFPQAERYLETFMSHAQAKCLIYLLALHKTYIAPKTSQLGLLVEHIRLFMLWECEANYSDWPEHRLGTKLMALIKNLNAQVAKCELRDFFIKEKNVLENTPKKYLRHAQKVFHEILESPVMSFIKSLRNLRYTRGDFYHPFDFDKLHEILIKTGVESTNPHLNSDISLPPNLRKKRYRDSEMQIRHLQEVQHKEKIIKKRQETIEGNLKEAEERRGSVDSVDMKWTCDKAFDVYKKKALLTFFIDTFIDIARNCLLISSHKQALFYLKQARYLSRILRDECSAMKVEEEIFLDQIEQLEDTCNKKAAKEDSQTIVQNGGVHFSAKVQVTKIDKSDAEKPQKVNGVVKPRKSVMFAEH